MKQIAATGLLVLLLLHMLGQTVAVLCLEERFSLPDSGTMGQERITLTVPFSIPYGANWSNDDPQGLIRYADGFYNIVAQRYENDSLYTVIQANLSAREQFFALADRIQQELGHTVDEAGGHHKQSAKIFSIAIKHYYAAARRVLFFVWEVTAKEERTRDRPLSLMAYILSPATPPPDRAA